MLKLNAKPRGQSIVFIHESPQPLNTVVLGKRFLKSFWRKNKSRQLQPNPCISGFSVSPKIPLCPWSFKINWTWACLSDRFELSPPVWSLCEITGINAFVLCVSFYRGFWTVGAMGSWGLEKRFWVQAGAWADSAVQVTCISWLWLGGDSGCRVPHKPAVVVWPQITFLEMNEAVSMVFIPRRCKFFMRMEFFSTKCQKPFRVSICWRNCGGTRVVCTPEFINEV